MGSPKAFKNSQKAYGFFMSQTEERVRSALALLHTAFLTYASAIKGTGDELPPLPKTPIDMLALYAAVATTVQDFSWPIMGKAMLTSSSDDPTYEDAACMVRCLESEEARLFMSKFLSNLLNTEAGPEIHLLFCCQIVNACIIIPGRLEMVMKGTIAKETDRLQNDLDGWLTYWQ